MDELESRLIRLREATQEAEPEMLVADLGPVTPMVEPPPVERALAKLEEARITTPKSRTTILNVFSGTERTGAWRPPELVKVVSVFGGATLDFRNAALVPGVTEVRCVSVFGGIDIVVPPDLPVEIEGLGVFGAFERKPKKKQ